MAHTYRGQDQRELAGRRMRRHALTPRQKARAGEVAVIKTARVEPATRPVPKSNLVRGVVVLAGVDFLEGSDAGRKVRPVVVLDGVTGGRGASCPALQIGSSAMRRGFLAGREYRFDADAAGLERGRSVVQLDRVVEVTTSDVYKVIGYLAADDMERIAMLRPSLPGNGPVVADLCESGIDQVNEIPA